MSQLRLLESTAVKNLNHDILCADLTCKLDFPVYHRPTSLPERKRATWGQSTKDPPRLKKNDTHVRRLGKLLGGGILHARFL